MVSLESILRNECKLFIAALPTLNLVEPEEMADNLLQRINCAINNENSDRAKHQKIRPVEFLPANMIAELIINTKIVRNIMLSNAADGTGSVLGIYIEEGEDKGLYSIDTDIISTLTKKFNSAAKSATVKEVLFNLQVKAPKVRRCDNADLIAVNNGVFNYKTKQLMDFSSEYVFLTKISVDFDLNAQNVHIHNSSDDTDWDVLSFLNEGLTDNPDISILLKEVIGAAIRNRVPWSKAVFLFSQIGNNGKGTFLRIIKNLLGNKAYAGLSLTDFNKDFMLEPLVSVDVVLSDETNVNEHLSSCAAFKSAVTGDSMFINRKNRPAITIEKRVFCVMCLNDPPSFKDKTNSIYRRQLYIPFNYEFEGKERKYIKEDYLQREDVLKFILKHVLVDMKDYYELSYPDACQVVLEYVKACNDPVRIFWDELNEQFAWSFLPNDFLFSLYKKWFKRNFPSGIVYGKTTFLQQLRSVVKDDSEWEVKDSNVRTAGKMIGPEPLIGEYDVVDWKNPTYTGNNSDVICTPKINEFYRGILRKNTDINSIDE